MFDTIVIGAGLGGLTAGAKLAKEGKRILLIEQHSLLGGYASSFRRKGSRMEIALHELDGLHAEDPKRKAFDDLGVMEKVKFLPLPSFYRFVWRGMDIDLPHGVEPAKAVLKKHFPDQKDAIDHYYADLPEIRKHFRGMSRVPDSNEPATAGEFLDQLTDDEGLKMILAGNVGYYHQDPFQVNLFYYAAGQSSYFTGGGYFIQGGSQALSDYLGRVIRNNGGTIATNHRVHKILVEEGRAVGVEYQKVHREGAKIIEARAENIVANAAVPNVIEHLLPAGAAPELEQKFKGWEHGTSATCLYLFLSRPGKELGNATYSTFQFDDEMEGIHDMGRFAYHSDFARRPMIFTDYSQVDSRLAKPGKGVASVCLLDRLSDWEGLDEHAYQTHKGRVTELLLARLERLVPGILEAVEHTELATPRTMAHYTGNPSGSIYGYAQSLAQSMPNRPTFRSPLPGLFFASSWGQIGAGFTGAILGGYHCAKEMLREPKESPP